MAVGEVTLIGDKALLAKFAGLPAKLQKKALRRGVSKAGRMTAKAAKAEAKKTSFETGALATAIGSRVFTFKDGSGVGAVVGARKDAKGKPARFRRGVVRKRGGFRKARKGETATGVRNPEKYLHLVLLGHRIAKGGTLIRTQARGWTPEGVWNPRHRTMQSRWYAPKRTSRSKRTGVAGGGSAAGRVPGDNFLLRAAMASRGESIRLIGIEIKQQVETELRENIPASQKY
ncbi:MAG TPA: hypothetical protein VM098_00475 [Phycisphaerae bacterium]|nr:hypothetical protein [Phycisphaerae bacterium]